MLQQAHLLGKGVIGQAAFTGKHQWVFYDSYCGEWGSSGSVNNQDEFKDDSEFHYQFLSGMKTIAVISVAPQGVIQFGSIQKIQENLEFVDEVKCVFRAFGSLSQPILSEDAASNLSGQVYDPSPLFGSVMLSEDSYSCYGNLKSLHGDGCKELMGNDYSTSLTSGFNHGSENPLIGSSFCLTNHFQSDGAEAQVILSKPSTQLLHSTSGLENRFFTSNPSIRACCSENSTQTTSEGKLLPGRGLQDSQNMFSAGQDTFLSCRSTFQNLQGNSNFMSSCSKDGLLNSVTNTGFLEVDKHEGNILEELVGVKHPFPKHDTNEGEFPKASTIPQMFEDFKLYKAMSALPKPNPMKNLSQLIVPPLAHGNDRLLAALNDDLSQALGVASVSSGLAGGDEFGGMSVNHAASSMQSSITGTVNSLGAVFADKEDSLNASMPLHSYNDLFDSWGLAFGHNQEQKCWEDVTPVGSASCSRSSNRISECFSQLDVGSMTGSQKGFFPEFGMEQLFNDFCQGSSLVRPTSNDQLSPTTMTRTGSSSMYSGQVHLGSSSCSVASISALLSQCNPEKVTMTGSQKEMVPKSQVGSWIDDNYSLNAESTVITQSRRSEEPAKITRKRARPGESARPRPKDRQQIQDRVKELREIVPNSSKCSIDALLDRTIKHMLFLQSVTKYADKLKQSNEPKMIGQESGVLLKDNSSAGAGGATWAFEVGGQTMVCPIIVEDLHPPGQMLIEMLCEERGFFLEIADIIRGFGLTILKGLMEARDDKIWARFVIEANRDVTRMDIFLSLVQLLQQTTSGISSNNQLNKLADSGIPTFSNYQQSPMPLPISLADRHQ